MNIKVRKKENPSPDGAEILEVTLTPQKWERFLGAKTKVRSLVNGGRNGNESKIVWLDAPDVFGEFPELERLYNIMNDRAWIKINARFRKPIKDIIKSLIGIIVSGVLWHFVFCNLLRTNIFCFWQIIYSLALLALGLIFLTFVRSFYILVVKGILF